MNRLNIQTLRRMAGIGLAIVLVVDFILSVRLRGGAGLGGVVLLLLTLGVAVTAWVLMPEATRTLLRHQNLLVPFALAVLAGKLITWLGAASFLGALLNPSWSLRLFNISLAISIGLLLQIAVTVAYATWMTAALLEWVRTENDDPSRVLSVVPGRFGRMFGLMFIGWALVMVVSAFLIFLMSALGYFVFGLMAVFAVVWNLATAAVLPVALERPGGFWDAFRAGVIVSWENCGRWWRLLVVQLLLLGMIFFYYGSQGGNTNMSWSVHVFWTGGYEDESRWYGKLADTMKIVRLPLVDTLLTLLFGAFAVVIKLAIVQRLQPTSPGE